MWERWRPFFVYVLPLLAIFGIVVRAMTAGWAAPTEAAALGAACTIVAAILYRGLTWQNLMKALLGTVAVSGVILFIILGATVFSQVLSFSGVVNGINGLIAGKNLSTITVLLGMIVILIFLGCFVDQVSMMLITLPFFMPLVVKLNIDPVWSGVMFLICSSSACASAFRPAAVHDEGGRTAAHHHEPDLSGGAPHVAVALIVLFAILSFPPIATWLPRLLGT